MLRPLDKKGRSVLYLSTTKHIEIVENNIHELCVCLLTHINTSQKKYL